MSRPPTLDAVHGRTTAPSAAGSLSVPRLELLVEREAGTPGERRQVIDGDVIRIGSHQSNDVLIDDPQVSRFHCRLARHARGWRLEDTGSMNGTRIAGVPVRDADLVFPECRLELGSSTIRVRELPDGASEPIAEALSCGSLYGKSATMRRLFHIISRVAKTDATVHVEGETGTGKELVAAEIVQRSRRRDKPLIIVDCGAIPTNLIESELFGHAKGAFTGAHQARVGAFEAADGGTVFLDEIGELPLEMQPKLLRALAQREVRRMGENNTRTVDVRVISATNRQLEREVNSGRFREDLYYRLAVVTLRVPPLRDRVEDIPLLVDYFLSTMDAIEKRDLFTPAVIAEMQGYRWPGNVRELRNFVERHVVSDLMGIPASSTGAPSSGRVSEAAVDVEQPYKVAKDALVTAFEQRYITALLAWADGNVSKAARKAGIDRMHMHRLMQRHGIQRPRDDDPASEA